MFHYIIPEYVDTLGDCCRLCNSEGETVHQQKVIIKLKSLYKEKLLDFDATKKKCSHMVNKKNLTPLYYGEKEVLIPIKVRIPIIPKDPLYGYVNIASIKQIQDKQLVLINGHKLNFFDTKRIIRERIHEAKGLEERFYYDTKQIELRKLLIPACAKDVDNILYAIKQLEEIILDLCSTNPDSN